MDVADIRLTNLRVVVRDYFQDNRSELARRCEFNQLYVHRWFWVGKPEFRNLSAKSARKIEVEAGLPRGWMDQSHVPAPVELYRAPPLEPTKADPNMHSIRLTSAPKPGDIIRITASKKNGAGRVFTGVIMRGR